MPSGGFAFGPFQLDTGAKRLFRTGVPLALTARHINLLSVLVGRAGDVVTKDYIVEVAWDGVAVGDNPQLSGRRYTASGSLSMGLDLIEFAFAVEKAFGLYLPEPEIVELATPGLLVDYLVKRLPPADTPQCLDQLAFYRIRTAVMLALQKPRSAVHPDTLWSSLIPPKDRRHSWELLRHAVGDTETVGRTARFVATRCPIAIKGPSKTWTRTEIAEVITRLMSDQLGVTRFNMTDHFVRDLKLD